MESGGFVIISLNGSRSNIAKAVLLQRKERSGIEEFGVHCENVLRNISWMAKLKLKVQGPCTVLSGYAITRFITPGWQHFEG
jgi:hypothetical protein